MQEKTCPHHGPYDARESECPFCRAERGGQRPSPPPPLGQNDDDRTKFGPGNEWQGPPNQGGYTHGTTQVGQGQQDFTKTQIDWDQQEREPLGFLIIKNGPRRGQVYKVKNGSTIGQNAEVMIDDRLISKQHARVRFNKDSDYFEIGDLMTTNKTFINGVAITQITELHENDVVKMGSTEFVFKVLLT